MGSLCFAAHKGKQQVRLMRASVGKSQRLSYSAHGIAATKLAYRPLPMLGAEQSASVCRVERTRDPCGAKCVPVAWNVEMLKLGHRAAPRDFGEVCITT